MKRVSKKTFIAHPMKRKVKILSRIEKRSKLLLKKILDLPLPPCPEIDMRLDHQNIELSSHEPMHFSRRIILRQQAGRIPPRRLGRLNKLYLNSAERADNTLATLAGQLDPTDEIAIKCRNLIHLNFARRLKKLSQLIGMFPTDLDITPRAQELLEEFHDVHGMPNEAEGDLLAMVLQCPRNTLHEWFRRKEETTKDLRNLERLAGVSRAAKVFDIYKHWALRVAVKKNIFAN